MSAHLTESESAKRLEQAIAAMRDTSNPVLRTTGLGVLSVRLSVERGVELLKGAIEMALTSGMPHFGPLLTTLHAPQDIQSAFEDGGREAELKSDEDGKIYTKATIHIVSGLTTGSTVMEMQPEVAEGVKMLNEYDKPMERLMTPLLILVFSPTLSTEETDNL